VEVEVLAVAPDEVATPGMLYALTAVATPTAAMARSATPAVSRLSIRVAASRARILGSFEMLLCMVLILARVA
jgi:hypothetical protein